MSSRIHPEHERLCAEVRSWYRTDQNGWRTERRRFGFYRRSTVSPAINRIVIEAATPDDVEALLADAREHLGNGEIEIWLDNRANEIALGTALRVAGCVQREATIYLAYTGPAIKAPLAADVSIEQVTTDSLLDEYVDVKLKGFANTEDEQLAAVVQHERAVRENDMRGPGRFLVARAGHEPAAIIGYYEGADRLIFNLATRLPFRNRGFARILLCKVLADSRHCRSVIINTNPDDTPINWYRRLGFEDEVYWYSRYRYRPV